MAAYEMHDIFEGMQDKCRAKDDCLSQSSSGPFSQETQGFETAHLTFKVLDFHVQTAKTPPVLHTLSSLLCILLVL